MDTEAINIHNEYLLKRYITIMKMQKFKKDSYNGAHIIPSTVLDALYELFFKPYHHSNNNNNMDYIVNISFLLWVRH